MTTTTNKLGVFLLAALSLGSAAWGQSQTDSQFNLLPPGARSLGMGGAFIGLADDATAAYSNPAGLTNLTLGGPEAAIELRQFDQSALFAESGRLAGRTQYVGIDTVPGLMVGETSSQTGGLSFLSFSYIIPGGFTLAAYRHQLANYAMEYSSQGVFTSDEIPVSGCPIGNYLLCRYPPNQTAAHIKIASYGLAGAYAFSRAAEGTDLSDSLSIGFGVSYSQLDYGFTRRFFLFYPPDSEPRDRVGGYYGPGNFAPGNLLAIHQIRGDDADISYNVGILWKQGDQRNQHKPEVSRRGHWSVGIVYRKGPSFEADSLLRLGRIDPTQQHHDDPGTFSVKIPDFYGIGVSYSRDEGKTKITLDCDRLLWSQRSHDMSPKGTTGREDFSIADTTEPHFGLERVVFALNPQIVGTLRLGAWQEPNHEVTYHGSDPRNKALYPKGKGQLHWSAGFGLVLKEDYQLDTAMDFSDRAKTVSFSIVKFF